MTEQERIKEANDKGLCGVFGCTRKHTKNGNIAVAFYGFGCLMGDSPPLGSQEDDRIVYERGKVCDEHFEYQDLEPVTVY